MSVFGGLILTNKGRNLLIKGQIGTVINYTRIGIGDGELSGSSVLELNALKHEVKTLEITKLKALTGGRFVVGSTFTNDDVTSGFYYRELGLFAQDPDLGEILYCYGNAGTLAEYITTGGGADLIEKAIDIEIIVGNASSVTATIDSSLVYATYEDLAVKVDKVTGKQLSTEDYSTAEKNKLSGVSTNANDYAHPTNHAPSVITQDASNRFVSDTEKTAWTAKETPTGAQAKVDTLAGSVESHLADYVKHVGYAVTTGVANVYVATLSPPPIDYVDGMGIVIKVNVTNTGDSTIDINGLGIISIKDNSGNVLTANKLNLNSQYTLRYESISGCFVIQGASSIPVNLFAQTTDPSAFAQPNDIWFDLTNRVINFRVGSAWESFGYTYQ
ncbi:MAG: hypothetical protein ACI8WT_002807 [Clostridium sp.]|jgi:hypothetical protein